MWSVEATRDSRALWTINIPRSTIQLVRIRDVPVRVDDRARALAAPALHVDGDRELADVRVGPLDVDGHGGGDAAQTLGADAGLVDEVEQLGFELRDERVGVVRADLAEAAGLLGHRGGEVARAA